MNTFLNRKTEQGRSMVEMLGTLAIIGVLSVGSIAGYRYAMEKYRTNEITETVSRMAIVVSSQLMIGREASLREFDTAGSGVNILGDYPTSVIEYDDNTFGIEVQNLSGTLCESIDKQEWPVLVDLLINNDDVCQDENNTMTFVFDNDLGKHEGCLGGYTGENCDEKIECENGGEWTPTGCECPEGWYGEKCDSDCDGWKDSYRRCYTCSSPYDGYSTLEECRRCGDRIMTENGTCAYCYTSGTFITTEEECHRCPNRYYDKESQKCIRCEVPGGNYAVGKEECERCDNRYYNETDGKCYNKCDEENKFQGLNNFCYDCTHQSSPETTETECNRCGSLRVYNTETGMCEFAKCPDNLVYGKSFHWLPGGYVGNLLGCYECSDSDWVYETTKEECNKCPNRTYDGTYCNP